MQEDVFSFMFTSARLNQLNQTDKYISQRGTEMAEHG